MSTATRPAAPAAAPRGLTRQDLGMLAVCLIWGANFTAMKIGMAEMPPLAFTAVRFAVGSVLLWAVLRVVEGKQGPLPAGSFRKLVWLGVVGNTLYQLAFTLGLDMSTASNTALIISTVPVVVAVMGGVLGIERTTSRMRWGLALATLGVALVVAARGIAFTTQTLAGDLLAVAAVLCWSAYTLGLRTLHDELSPLRVTAWTMYTGTPGLVLAGLPQLAGVD